MRRRVLIVVTWALVSCLGSAFAGAPVLEHLYPVGLAVGSTNRLRVGGKLDPWPVRAWVEGDGLRMIAETNRGEFRIEVDPGAATGIRWVRLFNEEGASEPRFLVVTQGREDEEAEPNDTFQQPQAIGTPPLSVNGRLDRNGDVDSYSLRLGAGEWLDARIDAYTLMSGVDAVLRLVTPNGFQLAWNHDDGSLDPRLVWQAPTDQSVVVQVFGFRYPADASIRLTGGDGVVYRLHLDVGRRRPERFAGGTREAESEPDDAADTAEVTTILEPPLNVVGTIRRPGDEDRYTFRTDAGKAYEIRVEAVGAGSPLDAWLKVEDETGKELARSDDTDGSPDPQLDWTAPAIGHYRLAVGSVTRAGGDDCLYRLSLCRGEPGFAGSLESGSWILASGATNDVKIRVSRRHGHTNELTAGFAGLPEGVTVEPASVAAGSSEVVLRMQVATNTPSWSGPVRVRLTDVVTGRSQDVPQWLTSRGMNNGVPQGFSRLLREEITDHWLTVRPPPADGTSHP